jgi:large subunit ribosomal protein L5
MNFLNYLQSKTLKHDLLNKFYYKNINDLPKLEKVILNFGCKTNDLKQLSTAILALELITNQKGILTKSKKSNILLKIRKGNPVGCKVTLKKKLMLKFLEKTLLEIFHKIKNFNGLTINKQINKNSFSYELYNTLSFKELEEHYYLFNSLPKLTITIVTNTTTKEELLFILKAWQFPLKKQ